MAAAPFDWSQYHRLAGELGSRKEEAALRSAISRAHYYVFHLAMERAERNGFSPIRGESTHIQLWRLFKKSPEPTCINLAEIALRLKEKRERADYDNSFVRLVEEVQPLLLDARKLAEMLNGLAPRHPNPASVRQ
jgi:uncharacterized protein (UPF0332 family)